MQHGLRERFLQHCIEAGCEALGDGALFIRVSGKCDDTCTLQVAAPVALTLGLFPRAHAANALKPIEVRHLQQRDTYVHGEAISMGEHEGRGLEWQQREWSGTGGRACRSMSVSVNCRPLVSTCSPSSPSHAMCTLPTHAICSSMMLVVSRMNGSSSTIHTESSTLPRAFVSACDRAMPLCSLE